jgi:hypothetical protein
MTAPSDFDLSTNAKGQLVLHRPSEEDLPEVRIRRAFPWSDADRFVSIRNKEGKEVLLIEDLAQLPPALAEKIRTSLGQSTLIPHITRITDLQTQFGYQSWTVETSGGPRSFRVQEREDVRFLPDGRLTVKDADGNLYELPPVENLDPRSQKLLEFLI